MSVDVVSALVRALSFVAMLQAAGAAIFIALFSAQLEGSTAAIRRLGSRSALAGIVLVFAHYSLEAGRMAGAYSGMFDASLQGIVFDSPMSVAFGSRLAGLALIALAIARGGAAWTAVSVLGAALAIAAFLIVGHTASDADRTWLGILLSLHLIVVAFWFGALAPLYIASRAEAPRTASFIVDRFSRIAVWWVPAIFVAGVLMTLLLIDRWAVFGEAYGAILIGKTAAFALLMVLAGLNKWRFGPALATSTNVVTSFQRAIALEYVLICGVLAATAVMTTFFSPEY